MAPCPRQMIYLCE